MFVTMFKENKLMKINVYINEEYAYTTNKLKTCKAAIAELKEKKTVTVTSFPDYKIEVKEGDKITARFKK